MRFLLLATLVCVCHIDVNQSDAISDVKAEVEKVASVIGFVLTKLSGYITAVEPVIEKLLPKLKKIGFQIGNSTRKQDASIRKQDVSLGLQFLSFTILVIYVLAISICKCVETVKQRQEEQMNQAVDNLEMKFVERQNLVEKQTKKRRQKTPDAEGSMA